MPRGENGLSMDVLDELLIDYYRSPALALWRGIEARLLRELEWPSAVLDVACGTGFFAQKVTSNFLAGFDLAGHVLKEAEQRQVYPILAQANAYNFPYPDNSFAGVFSNCAVEHMPDIDTVVSEISRVLVPGGKFIFTVPSEKFTDWLFFPWLRRQLGQQVEAEAHAKWFNTYQEHYHIDSCQIWEERLCKAGLQLEHCQYYMPFISMLIFSFLDDIWKGPLEGQPIRNFVCVGIRKVSLELITPPLSRKIWSLILRPFYRLNVPDTKQGAGLLIIATKPE